MYMMKFSILLVLSIALIAMSDAACSGKNVRLYSTTASSNATGMLQVCKSGQWTAVCDYRWTQSLSVKACKAVGFNNARPITYINSGKYWSTFGYVASTSRSCRQSTALTSNSCLLSSSSYLSSVIYCRKQRDTIYIDCNPSNTTGCNYRDIRLYNSTTGISSNTGMLQICNSNGRWTAVCDYSWACRESSVACKHLGYSNAVAQYSYNGGPWTEFGFGPYTYCSSSATSLFSCSSSTSFRNNQNYCNPLRDTVKLQCVTTPANNNCSTNYAVRLVGGPTVHEGVVEICYNYQWSSICGVYVNQKVASTICNQLGYKGNPFATVYTDGRYGQGNSSKYQTLNSPYCRSSYDSIRYCSLTSSSASCNINGCSYNRVGIKCYEPQDCNEGDVRLVNGTVEREGRVEVCAAGVWGTICGNSFAKSAAYVICKQLGHNDVNGAVINRNGKYGFGDGPVAYNNMECFGHEDTVASCSKKLYPDFYCSAYSVIGLLCLDLCTEGDIRLMGGSHPFEGTVEICLDKSWGLVSQHGWDDADARIVCKQIGGYNATAGVAVFNSTYGRPKRAVRYSNVYCLGNENELTDCTHHTFDFDYGRTLQVPAAGVNCGLSHSVTRSKTSSTSTASNDKATATSSRVITINTTPVTQRSTGQMQESIFVSGLLFLIIGICVIVIAIIIMFAVVMRMKKISIAQSGRNAGIQQMSYLEKNDSSAELTNSLSIKADDDLILK